MAKRPDQTGPADTIPQPEDEDNASDYGGVDDSDIPTRIVIQAMVQGSDNVKGRYSTHPEEGITMDSMAERFDDEDVKSVRISVCRSGPCN